MTAPATRTTLNRASSRPENSRLLIALKAADPEQRGIGDDVDQQVDLVAVADAVVLPLRLDELLEGHGVSALTGRVDMPGGRRQRAVPARLRCSALTMGVDATADVEDVRSGA